MAQQILIIHGGNAFETHEEYINDLKTKELTLDRIRFKDWKRGLGEVLGADYDVLVPVMPNAQNARYEEWKIWLEKIAALLDDEVILIGHSLGGITLAKYLSENDFPKKIKATFLVAAPFNAPDFHPLVDFNITNDLSRLANQGGKIHFYQSRDDEIVPFSNFENYQKLLPNAKTRIFTDRGHFKQKQLPEIVEDIKSL